MNHITNKKFAAHALLFDSQRWILKMIENCGPYVEKIYVAYSELPWTYNPNARSTMKNTADPSILLDSQYANKIELIRGVWERDEDQRNACLDRAKVDGMDFLIIQDADEFYKQRDYSRMIEQIANNPDYDFYKTPWCIFWKSFDYILEGENGSTVIGFPEVAINCKRNVSFMRARATNSNNYFLLDTLCYHGSFVSTDDEMYRKIHTWGHAHQFDRDAWYQNKWLRWTESTEDLHPVSPRVFRRAVRYTGDLPEILASESGTEKKYMGKHENRTPAINSAYYVNPDTFRRWMKVGSLIKGENLSILDVGGSPNNNQIIPFIPHKITAVNPRYNNISGTSLPFADESFDITISIDTLEHVPASEREIFIKELVRTARTKVILACPFDDPLVSGMEKAIYAITKNPFLEEHIKYGLPSLPQTLDVIEAMGLSFTIHNNDPLIAWASWILLHQTNMGRFNLSEVNYLLNQAYDVEENHETSYRKIIEVFKENPEKSMGAFSVVKTTSSTLGNGRQETATAHDGGFCEENPHHLNDNRNETCPATPVTKGMVSIVIPTITISYLAECIQSIEKNTPYPNYEIIIVNDGSSEPEFMKYLASTKHRVINLPNNVGFARANNEGFKVAKGEYIMTLNADTLVHENWLTIMIDTLESCDDIAAVGPTVLCAGTHIIETGGCFLDKDNARVVTSFLMGKTIQDYPQISTTYRVDTIGGVCMLFRRYPLFEVDLFDGNFINGWEDVDICLSLREKGYKIYHAPAVIEHYGSFTRNKSSTEDYAKKIRKNMDYFRKKLKKHALRLSDIAERSSQRGRYDEAIRHYQLAIETGVGLANNYYNLAIAYHHTNQTDVAIRCFEKVTEYEPQNAPAYNNLGVLYFSKGLRKKAEDYFNKALSLDAGYEEAKQNLKKLHLQ